METTLTDNQINYLLALANHRQREIARSVANFTPRHGQTPDDAAIQLAHFQRTLQFRTGVVATLTKMLADRGQTPMRPFGGKDSLKKHLDNSEHAC